MLGENVGIATTQTDQWGWYKNIVESTQTTSNIANA